jgi:pimeloyl-ACP methyl ester carboxylesterase
MSNTVENLRGLGRLTTDATTGLVDLVESMHRNLSPLQGLLDAQPSGRTRGITGAVYQGVRGIARLGGGATDLALGTLAPLLARLSGKESSPSSLQEGARAALNGVLGDYLAATRNPLAIPMQLRREGVALDRRNSAAQTMRWGNQWVVFVHGLCMNDRQWEAGEGHFGAALARDFGYTPLYLHYNTGLHISANGRALAELLENVFARLPEPPSEIVLIGHSMGGLVIRSASHIGAMAGHAWRARLRKAFFLGTPHHGAPLERGGAWIDTLLGANSFIAPFARLGKMRSAGITDLRYGNVLDEDWQGRDRFADRADSREPLPLPADVACYAIAATLSKRTGSLEHRLLGDGLVPLASALGRHAQPRHALRFPASRQWVGYRMHHLELLDSPHVYQQMARWLSER